MVNENVNVCATLGTKSTKNKDASCTQRQGQQARSNKQTAAKRNDSDINQQQRVLRTNEQTNERTNKRDVIGMVTNDKRHVMENKYQTNARINQDMIGQSFK